MRRFWGLAWLALCSSWGCGSKEAPTAPPLADCTTCGTGNPGGPLHRSEAGSEPEASHTEPNDATAHSGDAGAVSVQITVVELISDGPFVTPLGGASGPLIVSADGPSMMVDTGQAGVTVPVKLDGVASGSNWFAVRDATKAGTIASTLQPISVMGTDNPISVALVALSAGPLAATQIDRVPLGGPSSGEATIVLVFQQAGKSIPGVSVTGNPGNSTVAYYAGNGYQTPDMGTNVTGAQSTVLIAHVPVAAQFPQRLHLPLKYTVANKSFDIEVDVAPTFVTRMFVDVP